MHINELWYSENQNDWNNVLNNNYWKLIKKENIDLEKNIDPIDIIRISEMNDIQWYEFLKNEYFRWKYTAKNRYATTTKHFDKYIVENKLNELFLIKSKLLSMNIADIKNGLKTAMLIRGLGTAGASGLLSLMYSEYYGTVDQFVVQALSEIVDLPERDLVNSMNKDSLTIDDGVLLIRIMRQKADSLNNLFRNIFWNPRKIDKILWASRQG